MIIIDKEKVKEAVSEIEQSEYFQNVLSQVKKIRALRKNKNLREKYKIWKKILADTEYKNMIFYLKYYNFKLPDSSFEENSIIKDLKIKNYENIADNIIYEYKDGIIIKNPIKLDFDIYECSRLSESYDNINK